MDRLAGTFVFARITNKLPDVTAGTQGKQHDGLLHTSFRSRLNLHRPPLPPRALWQSSELQEMLTSFQ